MFTENINIGNNKRVVLLAVAFAVLGFAVAFVAAPFILQSVNGYEIPNTYYETITITKNATDTTEGYAINNYVETVKQDICRTLVNADEYNHCLGL